MIPIYETLSMNLYPSQQVPTNSPNLQSYSYASNHKSLPLEIRLIFSRVIECYHINPIKPYQTLSNPKRLSPNHTKVSQRTKSATQS